MDFLSDPNLSPTADNVISGIRSTLAAARSRQMPVAHVHYVTESDGRGLKAHHEALEMVRCARGTPGAEPHPVAAPKMGERSFAKHSLSAFSSVEFSSYVSEEGFDSLIICGLLSHACVRQTAMDALERGIEVQIVQDAIASNDQLHAQVTASYLAYRGATYETTTRIFAASSERLAPKPPHELKEPVGVHPVACIDGEWILRTNEKVEELRNPCDWNQLIGRAALAQENTISAAVSSSVFAQNEWAKGPFSERLALLERWSSILQKRADMFLPLMVAEVGKPVSASRFELKLLQDSISVLRKTIENGTFELVTKETEHQIAAARRRPQGVVGIISPWNNPIFLPASKIAAAITLGNGVVWKPALPCLRSSAELQQSLLDAGYPSGLVNLIHGGAATAKTLIAAPGVAAVTVTGSVKTGRDVAALCGAMLKPLQAELGGNNAAFVSDSCDLKSVSEAIARSAFGYAGQACTATRRVVVLESVQEEFLGYLKESVSALSIGEPSQNETFLGPVISKNHQLRLDDELAAIDASNIWYECPLPEHLNPDGCWMPPRIIGGLPLDSHLVQNESFAPILIIQSVQDTAEAIRVCNAVPQGLIASVFSDDPETLAQFRESSEVGIVQLNLPSRNLHMESPFCGWKHSGLGPPEHGRWDLEFYSRWQAVNTRR